MRIATWNLERPKAHGHAKNEACLGKLAEVDADLWILTETNAAIALRGYHHQSSPSVAGYHREGEHFTSLLSRWPLLRSIPTWDPLLAVCAELESPIGPMLLYGTIITYANDRGPTGSSRRWQEHRRSIERHQNDWVALRQRFPGHHLVVGGDFNQSRDGSGWYEDRESVAMLTEALSAADLTCLTQDKTREVLHLSRATIDHLCVSPSLAAKSHTVTAWEGRVGGLKVSDHNGIQVAFGS